jgi:TatA/E family protein of Tat protein translocase
MGPLGWQEMMFIFLLALLLFGPKKLPELGKMLGKAMTEFRRAQTELKSTFEREMRSLERENESLKEITSGYQFDSNTYNYDYSSYDSGTYGEPSGTSTSQDSTVTNTSTTGASATEGAGSISVAPAEGAIAHGTEGAPAEHSGEPHEGIQPQPAASSSSADHKA